MKEIIDQYAPILEGKVEPADVKKLQKSVRLNEAKSKNNKPQQTRLKPLRKLETSDMEVASNSTSSSSSHTTKDNGSFTKDNTFFVSIITGEDF